MSEKEPQSSKIILTMTKDGPKAVSKGKSLEKVFNEMSGGKTHKSLDDAFKHLKESLKKELK